MQIIPIVDDGTSQLQRTILSSFYQAFATGSWGGAQIEIQIAANAQSGWLTVATLTESNPFLESLQLMQGIYMQFVVSGSTLTTQLTLASGFAGVYQV